MKAWVKYARPLFAATVIAVAVTACDETLEGGIACPALCPAPTSQVRDTTILAVELDSTIGGFPSIGSEPEILLATRGDTLDTRAVIRFDSLPTTYQIPTTGVDSNITQVDSAMLLLKVADADTLGPPITVELYDVDSLAGDDTTLAVLLPKFDPSFLIGSKTIPAESLYKDTVRVPIDNAMLLQKILRTDAPHRLRLGVRITASKPAQIRISSQNGNFGQLLRFRVAPDTAVAPVTMAAYSATPGLTFLASDLADFQLIVKAPAAEPAGVLRVGGLPGKRAYMRFNIPAQILDSSSIIRAQLLMTQVPRPSTPDALDSAGVQPFAVAAGAVITDLTRLMEFLEGAQDSVRVVPADARVVPFEIIGLLRAWRGTTADKTPRAIALKATTEGTRGWLADFYSNEAADALRPRLKIYYVPRTEQGLR